MEIKFMNTYVTTLSVKDPDTDLPVDICVYKNPNGGMWAIDASYLENTDDAVFDPFGEGLIRGNHFETDTIPYTVLLLYPGAADTFLAHVSVEARFPDVYEEIEAARSAGAALATEVNTDPVTGDVLCQFDVDDVLSVAGGHINMIR